MIVKCRNREYDLTSNDIIATNGFAWWIQTREYYSNFSRVHPQLAKAKAKKMIKEKMIIPYKTVGAISYFKVK